VRENFEAHQQQQSTAPIQQAPVLTQPGQLPSLNQSTTSPLMTSRKSTWV
jgi:hypothetical protein